MTKGYKIRGRNREKKITTISGQSSLTALLYSNLRDEIRNRQRLPEYNLRAVSGPTTVCAKLVGDVIKTTTSDLKNVEVCLNSRSVHTKVEKTRMTPPATLENIRHRRRIGGRKKPHSPA